MTGDDGLPAPPDAPLPPPSVGARPASPAPTPASPALLDVVLSYHEQTKHHLDRYARSLGYLDWATQPDPWRRFEGAPRIELPLGPTFAAGPLHALGGRSGRGGESGAGVRALLAAPSSAPAPSPLTLSSIGRFLELSLALSAWKSFRGNAWALRINPSSGNLHPTEGYLVLPAVAGIGDTPGVYHYLSSDHLLERRASFAPGGFETAFPDLSPDSFLVGLSSIHWREAWKYGERAFRYCLHDVGHALAALSYAAACQGWSVRLLEGPGDADIAALLGLDRDTDFATAEREHPDLLVTVSSDSPRHRERGGPTPARTAPARAATADARVLETGRGPDSATPFSELLRDATWQGTANPLSPERVAWELIDHIATAALRPPGAFALPEALPSARASASLPPTGSEDAVTLIRRRRSAVDFDGSTELAAERFFSMLDRMLPRPGVPPFAALTWAPAVHLCLFVHRVHGIAPGLYLLVRNPADLAPLRAALHPHFLWTSLAGLPLWQLAAGDFKSTARNVSCHQNIAAEGCFSLGMLARFDEPLRTHGPWFYRRLFFETGAIGQAFYLEAENAGLRATGIGCFFDDEMHRILGLRDRAFQSLYHLALGAPEDDLRLLTLPPYHHLTRR